MMGGGGAGGAGEAGNPQQAFEIQGAIVTCDGYIGKAFLQLVARGLSSRPAILFEIRLNTGSSDTDEIPAAIITYQMSTDSAHALADAIDFKWEAFFEFLKTVDLSKVSSLTGFGIELAAETDIRKVPMVSKLHGISLGDREPVPFLGSALLGWTLRGALPGSPVPPKKVLTVAQQRIQTNILNALTSMYMKAAVFGRYKILLSKEGDTNIVWNDTPASESSIAALYSLMESDGSDFVERLVDISAMQSDTDNLVKVVGVKGCPEAGMVVAKYILWPGESKGIRADHEAVLACAITETLSAVCPGFVATHGAYTMDSTETTPKRVCMVMEVGGFPLNHANTLLHFQLRRTPQLWADVFMSIITQMTYAAMVLNRAGVTLLSDHLGNVLACPCDPRTTLTLHAHGTTIVVPSFGVMPKYIDWGQTRTQDMFQDTKWGQPYHSIAPLTFYQHATVYLREEAKRYGRTSDAYPALFNETLSAIHTLVPSDFDTEEYFEKPTPENHMPDYLPQLWVLCEDYFKKRAIATESTHEFTLPELPENGHSLLEMNMLPQMYDVKEAGEETGPTEAAEEP